MPAIIGVGRAKIIERVRARVARIVPANVEERQNNFKKKVSKVYIQGWKPYGRIHFMVEQQTT